jgi:hypothetical protein
MDQNMTMSRKGLGPDSPRRQQVTRKVVMLRKRSIMMM